MQTSGKSALVDLVHWNGELGALTAEAGRVSVAPGEEVVALDRSAARNSLQMFVAGLADANDLENWAEKVHELDGIGVEVGHEDVLTQFLFEISTPDLFEPITIELCRRWIEILQGE